MITAKQIKVLARAVDEAERWEGSMTGNPDTTQLDEFRAFIKEAREALRQLRRMRREAQRKYAVENPT